MNPTMRFSFCSFLLFFHLYYINIFGLEKKLTYNVVHKRMEVQHNPQGFRFRIEIGSDLLDQRSVSHNFGGAFFVSS